MEMKKLSIFILVFSLTLRLVAQQDPLSKEIFSAVNSARTNPTAFLKAHRAEIEAIEPKYISVLENTKPLPKAIWDSGLEAMTKSMVDRNDLNPKYNGKENVCGYSIGNMGGNLDRKAIRFVCAFYTNVHDPDYRFLGLSFNKNYSKYASCWGLSCEKTLIPFTFSSPIDSSKVDFTKINTAANAKYLSEVERRMVLEINFVRAYPKVYAQIVGQYLAAISKEDGGLTNEVYVAGMELMEELKAMQALPILQPKECVFQAARAHGLDCKQRGFIAHEGSDGKQPFDRIPKYCPDIDSGNENLVGNAASDARVPVLELLIDDGIPSRGHRYNILDPDWRWVGVFHYSEKPNRYYTMHNWVQNFAN